VTPKEKAVIDAAIEANPIGRLPSTAEQTVLRQAVHELIFNCPQCNAGGHTCPGDGNPISHTATDCLDEEPVLDEPVWVETAWKYVRRGDTVRMRDGGTPAEVQAICVQEFGQNIESRWSEDYGRWFDNYKGAWKHLEVSVRLSLAPEKIIPFPPNAAVQVLMNAERRAIHLLTEQLGGTEIPT
jgi:hypothetical protein